MIIRILICFILLFPFSLSYAQALDCQPLSSNNGSVINSINFTCLSKLKASSHLNLIKLILEEDTSPNFLAVKKEPINKDEIYKKLINQLLEKYNSNPDANYKLALVLLLDAVRQTQLQNFYGDDCLEFNYQHKIRPASNEAIYYIYKPAPKKFTAILLLGNSLIIKKLSAPDLLHLTNEYMNGLRASTGKANLKYIKRNSKRLYSIFLKPFENYLSKITNLLVVPEASLGIIPFESFFDGNQFVLEKDYAVSYLSSLSAPLKRSKNTTYSVLLATLKEFKNDQSLFVKQDIPVVHNVEGRELSQIGLFHAVSNHTYSIIHISSHAKFKDNYKDSHIVLSGKKELKMKGFERMISISSTKKTAPELLVLSACETAANGNLNEFAKVDASMGLAGIAVRAGVKSVVASLWKVNRHDALLAEKSFGFYHHIKNRKITKAKALQLGKIETYSSNESTRQGNNEVAWDSIRDWAAYILIGDWHEMGH